MTERKIEAMMETMRINEFLEVLSSNKPVPGGGGASALAGSIGMALGSMVANLTTGKKKYAQFQPEIDQIIIEADRITNELSAFMDKDAEAFDPLARAYGLPKNTKEEIEVRAEIMEQALLIASLTPIALMEKIMEAMKIMNRLGEIGSKLAISDAGVGIWLLFAALNGASLNVFINTNLMKNREKAEELNQKADDMIARGKQLFDETYSNVMGKIRQ